MQHCKHTTPATGLFSLPVALLWLLLSITLTLSACTKENWYEGVKASHEAQCMEEPISEYDNCMKQLQEQSYEEYQRDRESLK
jgi:hypothetical protein